MLSAKINAILPSIVLLRFFLPIVTTQGVVHPNVVAPDSTSLFETKIEEIDS